MTQRRRGRRFTPRAPRKAVEWFDTKLNQTLAIGSQISLDLTSAIANDEMKGMMAVRLIVDLTCTLAAADTGGLVSMGVALVSTEAANAAAFPEPSATNPEASWMWKVMNRLVSAASVNDPTQSVKFGIDTKVKRRVRFQEQQLRWIADQTGGTGNITINGMIRLLMQKA